MKFRPNDIDSSYSISEQKEIDTQMDAQYKKPKVKSSTDGLSYQKLAYIPSTLVLAAGNFMHVPSHIIFTLGRLLNLLVYSLVVFFAIKKLRSGKIIMAVVALLPTALFLASTYGYDWWVIAFTLLGLAYLFSVLQQPDKKLSWKEIVIMLGAFVIGLGPKAIYFPLMLLLYFVGRKKFETLKQYKIYLASVMLSILFVVGSFMLPFVVGGPGKGDQRGGDGVNSAQQVQYVLSQPFEYSKILSKFMVDYINPLKAEGFVTSFAYLGTMAGFSLVLLVLAVVTFTDKNELDKETSGWKIKASTIAIYLATVALISSALYVSFTPVASVSISGVQPRYLIPLVFPLLFIIGTSRLKNPFNKNIYNTVILAIMAGVLLNGIWHLIIRHYY